MKFLKIIGVFLISLILMSAVYIKEYNITLYPLNTADMVLSEVHEMVYAVNDNDLCNKILYSLRANDTLGLIPEASTVSVSGTTATVNFPKGMVQVLENNIENELFTIYSIVNSLTSSENIITVEFTIDHKKEKELFGYTDMRETFVPDYEICS